MVIVRIWEGLGNQLFQYAYARSLKERGYDVALDVEREYESCVGERKGITQRPCIIQNFYITIPFVDAEKMWQYGYLSHNNLLNKFVYSLACKGMWIYPFCEEENAFFNEKSYNPPKNGYLKGWYQSEKYFENIRDILLNELSLTRVPQLDPELEKYISSSRSVSIHIRRGDYLKIGMALNEIYYERAIKIIKEYCDSPIFIVFSDDINWVRKHISFPDEVIYVSDSGKYTDYEELYLMSLCQHNIISNSTFSWWGAWLNKNKEKKVIAPSKWLTSQKGIVPEDWIVV